MNCIHCLGIERYKNITVTGNISEQIFSVYYIIVVLFCVSVVLGQNWQCTLVTANTSLLSESDDLHISVTRLRKPRLTYLPTAKNVKPGLTWVAICTQRSRAYSGYSSLGCQDRRPRAGVGNFLRRWKQPPPHQLEGLEKRCELPQRGSGQSPYRPKVFHFSTRGWPVSILLIIIVDYHAAIVGAKTPCLPPCICPCQRCDLSWHWPSLIQWYV